MSINAVDSFPPGIATINGLTVLSCFGGPSVSGEVNFGGITFLAFNGGSDSSGSYNTDNVTYNAASESLGYGSFNNTFAGEMSVTMDDTGYSGTCNFSATVTGRVDTISFNVQSYGSGGGSQSLTTNQSTALTISELQYGNPSQGQTVTLNAASLTSLTVPSSMNLSYATTTFDGAFDQASVDGILAAAVAGSSSDGGSLTIGGTSSAPSSTGAANAATLISSGMTISTN